MSSFNTSEKIHHRVQPPATACYTEGEQLDKHKSSFDCENDSSYQSKPLLDYNEKQCYRKDIERTIAVESEMHEVSRAQTPDINANWSLNRSNSDRSDRLLSFIILTSQTLLVITGVQTLKMMLHFFLKYRILFCHKDLVSTPLFCQQLSKCGKLEIYLLLMKLASHGNCHLCKFQSCPDSKQITVTFHAKFPGFPLELEMGRHFPVREF